MEQEGLEAAAVGSELVPDDFTEEDHGDVVLHLKTTGVCDGVSPWLQMLPNTSGKTLPSQVQ